MRFAYLEAVSFGVLKDRELAVDSDVVLVCGPNEAGKSTFRAAVETILYGFKPADRDAHPLATWNPERPDPLHLEADIQLDAGEVQRVERVMLRTGKSRLAPGGSRFGGPRRGNAGLPWVAWLSRDVFRALYSLELSQLAAIDPSVRGDVDELLLPRTTELPLRAISEVRAELTREHRDLWRPDNRGKPLAKQLRARLASARTAAAEAGRRERALRLARSEHAKLADRVEQLRARKRDAEREHADAPILAALFEHRRRVRRLGAALDLSALGDHPLVAPSTLGAEIHELEDRLREPEARLERTAVEVSERDRRVLDALPEIEHAVSEHAAWQAESQRLDEQRQVARALHLRARDELGRATRGAPDDDALRLADAIPLEALDALALQWAEACETHAAESARFDNRSRAGLLVAGLIGVGLAGLGWWGHVDARLVPIGLGTVLATLLASLYLKLTRRHPPPARPAEVDAMFDRIDVDETLIASPSTLQRLATLFEGVRRQQLDARAAEQSAARIGAVMSEREVRWSELCERIGTAPKRGSAAVASLRSAAEAARALRERARDDAAEREEAARAIERDRPLLARKRRHAESLESALRGAAPDPSSLDEAFAWVRERLAEEDFLRRREAELREDPRFALFESDPRVFGDRPPEGAPWLPDVTAAREAEIAALETELADALRRFGELTELLGSDEGSSVARATDELRDVEQQLADAERERDRLALLARIVARAESDFRRSHQPDVLRRASNYLDRVTSGRYARIDVLDESDSRLGVTGAGRSDPIPVGPPLSQGTLDQIYLCVRLGLLDHLDEDRERLPLILDDALLRMDDRRRQQVYALLGELAPSRQVFLLTCHGAIADEVESALKVRRVDL